MIILRKGEERQGYRVLMVKLSPHSETKFSVQKKVKFLWFFTKWENVLDKYGFSLLSREDASKIGLPEEEANWRWKRIMRRANLSSSLKISTPSANFDSGSRRLDGTRNAL